MTDSTPEGPGPAEDLAARSLTRLVAPIFAVFILPTIFMFVPATFPRQPWHDLILSLLVAATGLFMASIQLSIGRLYDNFNHHRRFRVFRAQLTVIGIGLVALAMTVLVSATADTAWIWLPLALLLAGGVGPGLAMLAVTDIDYVGSRRRLSAPAEAGEAGGTGSGRGN